MLNLSFPDSTYTSANKPSVETLKSDLSLIETGVNALIDTDGTLSDNSDLVAPSQKAVKTYADNHGSPTGSILPFAGSSAPTGFLIADGASLLRADYAALFAVIGTTYGSADGTHFTLPNLKGKVVVGVNASETEFDVLGETGGEKFHLLTGAESGTSVHGHLQSTSGTSGSSLGLTPKFDAKNITDSALTQLGTVQNSVAANAASAHNNLQPYISLNFIIKT